MEDQVDIRFRINQLKKEARDLTNTLRVFWACFILGGGLLFVFARRELVIFYFLVYVIGFLVMGRILVGRYKNFYLKKGDLYLDLKKFDIALASFQKVANIQGHNSEEGLYKVALCLDRMGDIYRALGAYDCYLHKYKNGRWQDSARGALLVLREQKGKSKKAPLAENQSCKESSSSQIEDPFSASSPEESVAEKVESLLTLWLEEPQKEGRFSQGQKIGDYILEAKIKEGGFGEVWKAHHHLFRDRQVALKIPTHADYISNLKKLGIIQNSLKSPYIVRPENIDTESDPAYLAMEYVDGVDLQVLLGHPFGLSVVEVVYLLSQILEGLKVAHHHEIVHRDLKPANILVDREARVKLTDFELGKVNVLTTSLSISQTRGDVKGSLLYMAPEQMQGEEVDQRADIYSFGVILFEMIAGELPQPGDRLIDFDPQIPPPLDELFQGCYTRWEKRFSSVEEMEEVLEKLADL